MPTGYAWAFFRRTLTLGFNFLAYLYVQPSMIFWLYIAIFKTYYTPIRLLCQCHCQCYCKISSEISKRTWVHHI